jgi:predicted dehydrogenase
MRQCLLLALFCAWTVSAFAADAPKTIRVGMIGLDTSHVIAFSDVLNSPNNEGDLAGVRVTVGYPGGSPDLPASRDRVAGYTEKLREKGVEIVDSVEELVKRVDAVLLMSVDGRPHLEQVRPVIAAGKPVFVDKPFAGSLADCLEIVRLAKEKNVPIFSSSSTRFSSTFQAARKGESDAGEVRGCDARSPCSLEPNHPDLYWYGIHGVEILFTVMGPGCESVTRVKTDGTDIVVGTWKDGRQGVFRGIREGKADYGAVVFGKKGVAAVGPYEGYKPLVVEIARFFKTGKPPVDMDETIEIYTFMEAADESKRQGGCPVKMDAVLQKARGKSE